MQRTKELRTYADDITVKVLQAQKEYIANMPNVQSYLRPYYKYEEMLAHVLMNGRPKADRTGTGTWGVHGYQLRFDLDRAKIPIVICPFIPNSYIVFIEIPNVSITL
jgi:hypothetical protein